MNDETIARLFATIREMDADGFVEFLTRDAVFRFANRMPVAGKAAIQGMVAAFFESIGGIRHEIDRTWHLSDTTICEGRVTYTRHDGSHLTVPFADVFKLEDQLIKAYWVYVDASGL
jgi:ketosteroid isomerase-like protein